MNGHIKGAETPRTWSIQEMDSKEARFKCDLCQKRYSKFKELERHRRSFHFSVQLDVEKRFICQRCKCATNCVTQANKHRAAHIRESKFYLDESGFRYHFIYKTRLVDNPTPPYIHPEELSTSEVAPRILELIEANLILHRQLYVYIQSKSCEDLKSFKKSKGFFYCFFSRRCL